MRRKAVKENPAQLTNEKAKTRVQIENVRPKINGGRFPIKAVIDDTIRVEADIFVDGHNEISAVLLYRREDQSQWHSVPMKALPNDLWTAEFKVTEIGLWLYTVEAWIDHFETWQRDFKKRVDAEQDVTVDLMIGMEWVNKAVKIASPKDREKLNKLLHKLSDKRNKAEANKTALSEELSKVMARYPDKTGIAKYNREIPVVVDPKIARFSAWYECFPRSCSSTPGKHGTFKDVIARLPYVAEMGFNVLYLPPIHPIGTQFRKGKNNSVTAHKGDVGSPWAIGSKDGGHKSIHPQLGTMEDFKELLREAEEHGITVALDLAYQCSPDHPYVKEHPEWFRKRPDGTIQYAENPPKKYQDIYPIDFETADWQALWEELKSVVTFWIGQGVKIFRVDNPHTKDLSFWEWLITGVKKDHPEVLFLSEAFTRPKPMYRLAKLGFSQSYNYFPWRNAKWELTQYFTEINKTDVKHFFRANLWPNTPDILTEFLQVGGPNAFKIRFVLASTLGASYGIYGPAFELCDNKPVSVKSEEYLNSEKYEIKKWDINDPASLKPLITQINQIRSQHASLQSDQSLEFFPTDNDALLCYSKHSEDYSEVLVVVVNLDPVNTQAGWVELPLEKMSISETRTFQVHDLLSGARYLWSGRKNFIKLDPAKAPAHIFRVRRYQRTEKDFDYYV